MGAWQYGPKAWGAGLVILLANAGCSSILGDFTVKGGDGGTVTVIPDASGDDGSVDASGDDGSVVGPADGSVDGSASADKSRFDLTTGGNVSKSTNYKLWGAVGEGPGHNRISTSTSYKLRGGIVAGTQ